MKRLTIIGNLGRDPESRNDKYGNSFVTFSVAVSVGNKDKPRTDWVDVSCNGKLAEIATTYAKKGYKVFVEGFPDVSAYTNNANVVVAVQRLYAHSIKILNRNEHDSTQEVSAEVHEDCDISDDSAISEQQRVAVGAE
ncbi:MAG: single-stranded DNA-binding protein [Burkholderiales bacterium]|nr:single-stranded DNA-binding protein [Burkholderiales bacterium]